ncbi:MAG: hypothetical protein C3F02_01595 [Parcubacteria group bacterium]|nr:MAG: hypothetical protein C3F02_01595 [Parcubacteria group bacterium]
MASMICIGRLSSGKDDPFYHHPVAMSQVAYREDQEKRQRTWSFQCTACGNKKKMFVSMDNEQTTFDLFASVDRKGEWQL